MPIQTVETHRLYRQIADQLAKLIEGGEFTPGQRLPPERNLAHQFGVSRPSVREALIALEVEGYIEVRVGSGVYVTNSGKSVDRLSPLPPDSGPFEVMHARQLIESECAAMAAKEATRDQIRAIEEAFEAMAAGQRDPNAMPLAVDRLFHLRIAEASGNSALALAVKTLWDQRVGPLFLRLESHFTKPTTWNMTLKEHRNVLSAIAKRDAKTARMSMRLHLGKAARRFSKSFGEEK